MITSQSHKSFRNNIPGKRITHYKLFRLPLLLLFSILIFNPALSKERFRNKIIWQELPALPATPGQVIQPGLASPFSGVSENMLLVAGGCNFPDEEVWEGGQKAYYDDAFALEQTEDGENIWHTGFKIPYTSAYGVSITVPEGVICIGGSNNSGSLSSVFMMKWDPDLEEIVTENLPPLPFKISRMTGALVDQEIYLAGGLADGQLANTFIRLDLSMWGDDDFEWEILDDFPGPPRLQAIAVGQNAAEEKHFYLFSGSSYPGHEENPIILTDGLEYNPKTEKWTIIPDIKHDGGDALSLHGGSAVAIGTQHILFTGGVNRSIFYNAWKRDRDIELARTVNDTVQMKHLLQEKHDYFLMEPEEYKFNQAVLAYHTITKTWIKVDDYPFPGPAGAPMVEWLDGFAVVNGEIKPGVRSPNIYYGQSQYTPVFGWINWSVVAIYLLFMVLLGFYFMKREEGTNTFFKGGQRIPWWAAGMSIFATMLSAITYMSIPAKSYATDWQYYIMAITIFILVWPVVRYYLPFFRRLNVTTAYEYLEKRFNYALRVLTSSLFQVFLVARMALVLFLPSLALTTVTGINIYLCIVLMGVITILYCTMGGVEAVIWGDVIQGFVLMGGAILVVIFMISGTEGGLNRVIEITIEHEKMKMFDFVFDLSKTTFWVVLLGGLGNNLISYTSDQSVIQRYLTTKNQKAAGKGLWFNGTMSLLISIIFYFIGTTLFVLYKTQPQELNMAMSQPDSIFPHFIMTRMPVGIAGLLIAAIFAATMSTVSSNVNSISTAFTTDIYNHLWPGSPDSRRLRVARISGILSGGLGIALALLMAGWNILSLFDYYNIILGLLGGGIAGVFAMAIFFPRINTRGAITGFIMSIIILMIIMNYSSVHLLLYGFLGITISIIIAYIVSLFTPEDKNDLAGLTYKTLDK
jgi:cyclically-permuted mutarotase family protein